MQIPAFPHLLTLIFVTLKLTGYIAWSWFWVILPSLILVFLLLIIGLIGWGLKEKLK